jgi:hypothetical protein
VIARAWLAPWLTAALALASCEGVEPPFSAGGANVPPHPGHTGASDEGAGGAELDPGADPGVTAALGQLVDAIRANEGAYDAIDRSDLTDLLALALVRASSPGGRAAASAECVAQAAVQGFSHAQAARLCVDDRFDSAACAARALAVLQFDREAAVVLCAGRGSIETADCARDVFAPLGSSPARAAEVCADREGAGVASCVTSAVGTGFDYEQTVALCARRGRLSTVTCAQSALAGGFSRDEAAALCANRGAVETFRCASAASASFGFSRRQAVDLCANRGQEGNATCASRVLVLGASRDEAVEACRRPPTVLVP